MQLGQQAFAQPGRSSRREMLAAAGLLGALPLKGGLKLFRRGLTWTCQ